MGKGGRRSRDKKTFIQGNLSYAMNNIAYREETKLCTTQQKVW